MTKFKASDRSTIVLDRTSVKNAERIGNFKLSLSYFDPSQRFASGFRDWQKVGLLSKAMETIQGFCNRPLRQQVDGTKFAIYGAFPPKDVTEFDYPSHVPEDAEWARIHVTGKAVLIGHIVNDTFYLVFLDRSHKFWPSKK